MIKIIFLILALLPINLAAQNNNSKDFILGLGVGLGVNSAGDLGINISPALGFDVVLNTWDVNGTGLAVSLGAASVFYLLQDEHRYMIGPRSTFFVSIIEDIDFFFALGISMDVGIGKGLLRGYGLNKKFNVGAIVETGFDFWFSQKTGLSIFAGHYGSANTAIGLAFKFRIDTQKGLTKGVADNFRIS